MNSTYDNQNQGPQNIPVNAFLSDVEWKKDRTTGAFDYVIVGSSFCAMGFTHQILKNNSNAKILILERGDCECFQSLSPLDLRQKEKNTEETPWKFSPREGEHIESVRGMNHFFGGRSSFWKAWCPKPTKEEMAEWPEEVIEKVHKYFPDAERLLKVRGVNEIGGNLFGNLQEIIFRELKSTPSIEAITGIQHAPLAVIEKKCRYGDHQKYSVLQPLLNILIAKENVKAVTCCLVKRIRHENSRAAFLETSKGDLTLGRAKLILAMSTLPSTTLMLNSFSPSTFKQLSSIGKRFTAHFASYIFARVPFDKSIYASVQEKATEKLEMAAMYVTGENKESKHQFHIQLTAVAVGDEPLNGVYDTMCNLLKTPSKHKLSSCKNHIVFVCASIGQLDHNNPTNKVYLNDDADITSNTTLHFAANGKDSALWSTMDEATFEILERLTSVKTIEYWNSEHWQTDRPPVEQIRSRSLVHPASTMWIGRDMDSTPVNLDYRFHGVDNVYLTGGALWPTGASWNPTCTMTAMAMDLADRLSLD